jgi:predicted ribosome quality control (RQC) complex YloA/Tae2 family protein
MLTPVENIKRYYKEYRKADTAERILKGLIAEGERDLSYLDSIADAMARAKSDGELTAIRSELVLFGYLAKPTNKNKNKKAKPDSFNPLVYRSSDGFTILCGRNNLQNDRLTLKDSRRDDMWFHVQGMPGAHTVVVTDGRELPERTIEEAATIAAVNSKAAKSNKVSVDYTPVRNVRKQPGGRPGMVIYDKFKTVVVIPDAQAVLRLEQTNPVAAPHRV